VSERDGMTAEEARDLQEKLQAFAANLTPSQRRYLSALLVAGAGSDEVTGYMMFTAPLSHFGSVGAAQPSVDEACTNNNCSGVTDCPLSGRC